jgi:hypothetical protein
MEHCTQAMAHWSVNRAAEAVHSTVRALREDYQ